MKYTIGIDMGINNVGWSILDEDNKKIEKCGVRLFNVSNSAQDRREARNARRRLKRKDNRVNDMLKQLDNIDFPNKLTIDSNLITKRYKGISEKITKQDITNILCYMTSHRGYIPFGDEDVTFVDLNGKLPCEYYYDLYLKEGKYRGMDLTVKIEDNINEIKKMLNVQSKYYSEITENFIDKVIDIFKRKRHFYEGPGSTKSLTPYGRFKNNGDVIEYLNNKDVDDKYEKYIFEDLIGKCKIKIDERCTTKANFYAEKFNLLNDFINISFKSIDDVKNSDCFQLKEWEEVYKLNRKGLELVIDYCINNSNLTITKLFKELFNTKIDNVMGYRIDKNGKPVFSTLNTYRNVKDYFTNSMIETKLLDIDDISKYNDIMYQFTVAPGVVEAMKMVKSRVKYNFSEQELIVLKELYPKLKKKSDKSDKGTVLTYHSLSETVLKRAIDDMLKTQLNFMQVRRKFDYDKEAREFFSENYENLDDGLPLMNNKFVDEIIASPQVKKSLRQAIKIINAIIKEKQCLPNNIVIESTKELNSDEKKKEIEKEQRINEKLRKDAIDKLKVYNLEENSTNILKTILYNEMNGHCAYCNSIISYDLIMNPAYQIEHILPVSKSSDNSYLNKTIACRDCNSKKGNKTPYQFLNSDMYQEYKIRIKANKNLSELKKERLLYEEDIDKYKTRFFNRNLRDTAYATTELIKQINLFNYYLEANYNDLKVNTLSIPGQVTHNIREKYNLDKNRDKGCSHHAVDASILSSFAMTEVGQKLLYIQNNPKFWIRKDKDIVINEVNGKLNNICINDYIEKIKSIKDEDKDSFYISKQVDKDYNSQFSDSNIRKFIKKDDQFFVIEQINDIYDKNLDIKKIERLLDENDEAFTLLCYDNNKELFYRLKDIYEMYKGIKGNPFENYCKEKVDNKDNFDFRKDGIRSSSNPNSPIVKVLRYYSKVSNPYILDKDNIDNKENTYIGYTSLKQVCTKVYYDLDNNKFLFLPIPKICVNQENGKIDKNNKYYNKLYNMYIGDSNAKHIVDLYTGNSVEIIKKDCVINDYYEYFHIKNNAICLKNGSGFTKSDKGIIVYDVDILGNRKKRLTFIKE